MLSRILILLVLVLFAGCKRDPFNPAMGPRNPRPGAESYLQTRSDIPQDQKNALLDRKACGISTLWKLSNASAPEVRALVAANPSVDLPLLDFMVADPDPAVRQYVASNRKTPESVLVKLKDDPDQGVRWTLPSNPNWSAEQIRQMNREAGFAKMPIASNPSAPADVLEELAKTGNTNVCVALASNPSINEEVTHKLFTKGPAVRKLLVTNPATPLEVLKELAKDPDVDVQQMAKASLDERKQTGNNPAQNERTGPR